MATLDPYQKWLGISPSEQPPDHYQLLGIERYESDEKVIETACAQRVAKLQDLSHGEHVELAQKLLNDVARAKLCLTAKAEKFKYDLALRKELSGAGKAVASKSVPQPNTDVHQANAAATTAGSSGPANVTGATAVEQPNPIQSPPVSAGVVISSAANHGSVKSKPRTAAKRKPSKPSPMAGIALGGLVAVALTAVGGALIYSRISSDSTVSHTANEEYFDENWTAAKEKVVVKKEPNARKKDTASESSKTQKQPKDSTAKKRRLPAPPPPAEKAKVADPKIADGAIVFSPMTENTLSNWSPANGAPIHDQLLDPKETDLWGDSLRGKIVVIEGEIDEISRSHSRKTTYLWFGKKHECACMMVTHKWAKSLSPEYLDSLSGKRVRLTGKARKEANGRTGVGFSNKAQLEILSE